MHSRAASALAAALCLPHPSCRAFSLLPSTVNRRNSNKMPAAAMVTSAQTSTSSSPPLIPLLPETIAAAAKRSKKNPGGPSEMPALNLHPTVGEYPVDYTMHAENRAKVIARLRETDGVAPRGLLLFRGGLAATRDETDHEPVFRQESTFHYLFGVREPDCLATVDLATGKATLFIPRLPAEYATWMGNILPPKHFQVQSTEVPVYYRTCLGGSDGMLVFSFVGGKFGDPADALIMYIHTQNSRTGGRR